MLLVATMTVRREAVEDFRAFERRAATIMAKYGGVIERTIVADDGSAPLQEVQVVRFPDERALAAYQADEGLQRIAPLRVRSRTVTVSVRRPPAGQEQGT